MGFQKIFIALDESELSHSVFDRALDLAQLSGAELMLFHCLVPELVGESIGPMSAELGLYPEMVERTYQAQYQQVEQHKDRVRQRLQHYCEIAIAREVAAQFDAQIGEAGPSICESAHNWQADLIVVGRRGRSGLTEVLLGSVSNYVVHHAQCAVLIIQAGKSPSAPTQPSHTEMKTLGSC